MHWLAVPLNQNFFIVNIIPWIQKKEICVYRDTLHNSVGEEDDDLDFEWLVLFIIVLSIGS